MALSFVVAEICVSDLVWRYEKRRLWRLYGEILGVIGGGWSMVAIFDRQRWATVGRER